MSINVTVSGNPVSIRRGKMVTACDPAKSEFEKRRLMRLEQVRQQSRDIAENIRNKLKKEKIKCLSEIEKEGEVKLKNWQARKLLELQNQYQEALDEIGIGHKEALRAESENETFLEQQEINDKIARERGRAAVERLQIEKNETNLIKAVPIQRKKMSRDMENIRSSAVTSLRKIKQSRNSFKKKKKQQGQSYDSDSENRIPKLPDLEKIDSFSSASLEADNSREVSVRKMSKEQQTSGTYFQVPQSDKAAQTLNQEEIAVGMPQEVLMDTRISEHIKRRTRLNPLSDYCELADKQLPLRSFNKTHCPCCHCLERKEMTELLQNHLEETHSQQPTEPTTSHQLLRENKAVNKPIQPKELTIRIHQSLEQNKAAVKTRPVRASAVRSQLQTKEPIISKELVETPATRPPGPKIDILTKSPGEFASATKSKDPQDLPSKPKITLRSSTDRVPIVDQNIKSPVQYYDHPNRFSKHYVPSTSQVERIDDDHLQVSPVTLSEDEVLEKMRRRDVEAHVRGQVAMEKERIRREYRELLKKLPVLQKQERIYEIGTDKEKYHMSRDRLEETERRRQNRLDNAYEELFVRWKPTAVTLPRRKPEETAPSLNLATWDIDLDPVAPNLNRTEQLNNLLSNLRTQKESLLREIENTLSKETLNELTKNSHEDVKSKSTDYLQTKRKRSRDERPPSPTSSDIVFDELTENKSKSTKKGTLTSPSPRKKAKLKSKKKKVLVLQNSSTQTTPKMGYSGATSPVSEEVDREKCSCPKRIVDDLCEIVIKIKEDEKPEVTVNPPAMEKTLNVVTEEKKMKGSDENIIEKNKSVENSVDRDEHKAGKLTGSSKKSLKTFFWKENLTHSVSSSQSTSTSTSYFEPPSFKSVRVPKTMQKSVPFEENLKFSTRQSDGSKRLDPRLLTYMKRLLNMSRASIDELAVSAASEVSTPNESVVNAPTNNPLLQLKNVMRYFNLDCAELQKQLSYISDDNSLHYNTSESVTISSSTSEAFKSFQFKTCKEVDSAENKQQPSNKLLEYADIAASCTKKISSLTAMIQKVREEKKKILQSPPTSSCSDKDISTTSYLGLPGTKKDDAESSSSTSTTQEDLDKRLLTIDISYAERLKRLTDEEMQTEKKRTEAEQEPQDKELLIRLRSLLHDNGKKPEERKTEEGKEEDHPLLFLDIPKLPRLEVPSLEDEKKKRCPPPSKGLRILGGPVIAHELSTIVEADSQLSVKVESPAKEDSPKTSSKSSSVPDILTEVPPHKESNNSSDDISEMETMLISIGMEWAIPTLKKTREALALSSSSGSGSSKKDSGELSLREFLSRISSSSSSTLSDSQGISLIQVDNRRTSTPILETAKKDGPVFLTDSDLSSVREQSNDASKTG